MRIFLRKTRRLIANVEKLFAFVDDVGFLKTLFAHKINLLLQAFKARSQLFHFRLKTLVVQSHKGKLVIAEAQTVDKRFHALHHPVLRLTRNLHFDKALRFAAHKARIVHHARRALNARDQHHHPNDQRRQNHGQHADGRLHGIRYFLVFPHILHRFESFGVIHCRTLSQNLMVHYSTFMFRLQHKKRPDLCASNCQRSDCCLLYAPHRPHVFPKALFTISAYSFFTFSGSVIRIFPP